MKKTNQLLQGTLLILFLLVSVGLQAQTTKADGEQPSTTVLSEDATSESETQNVIRVIEQRKATVPHTAAYKAAAIVKIDKAIDGLISKIEAGNISAARKQKYEDALQALRDKKAIYEN